MTEKKPELWQFILQFNHEITTDRITIIKTADNGKTLIAQIGVVLDEISKQRDDLLCQDGKNDE